MQDDQLEIGEEHVRGLFETISAGYQRPVADLVPEALAAARRATRRRGIAYTFGAGVLAAAGALALTVGNLGTRPVATGSGGSVEITSPKGASEIAQDCTGVYLPWSSGSDASMYGKGSNAQRTTICEHDLAALDVLLPGYAVSQSTQQYGVGVQVGEIMPDQIAEMGPGMKADTPVLNPWQYNVAVSAHGQSAIINIEYARDTTGLACSPCNANTPLANGFTLVDTIASTSSSGPYAGVQLKTRQGEFIQVHIGATALNAPTLDPVKLVEKPGFTAMLAADLAIIGDN
jgi:hypothetical protein